jgi:hypothetical protein
MHLKGEEGATPSADVTARVGAVDKPCLGVKSWLDGLIDEAGHDLRSERVETFWLSVPGQPSLQPPCVNASHCSRRSRQVSRTPGAVRAAIHGMQGPT